MTDQLFFDTDCISSFLWVKQESLILQRLPAATFSDYIVYSSAV